MDQKINEKEQKRDLIVGSVHLFFFLFLILLGIYVKRVHNHPEFMMLFHGPAAVFLVVGGMKIMKRQRRKYDLLHWKP